MLQSFHFQFLQCLDKTKTYCSPQSSALAVLHNCYHIPEQSKLSFSHLWPNIRLIKLKLKLNQTELNIT